MKKILKKYNLIKKYIVPTHLSSRKFQIVSLSVKATMIKILINNYNKMENKCIYIEMMLMVQGVKLNMIIMIKKIYLKALTSKLIINYLNPL